MITCLVSSYCLIQLAYFCRSNFQRPYIIGVIFKWTNKQILLGRTRKKRSYRLQGVQSQNWCAFRSSHSRRTLKLPFYPAPLAAACLPFIYISFVIHISRSVERRRAIRFPRKPRTRKPLSLLSVSLSLSEFSDFKGTIRFPSPFNRPLQAPVTNI